MSVEEGDCLSCHNTVHLAIQEQDLDLRLRMLEQTMCGICWCPLVNSDTCPAQVQTMFPVAPDAPVVVNCGHVFHPDCLNSRSQFSVTANFHCPLCGEIIADTRSIHLIDGDTSPIHDISSRCSSGYNSPSSYSENILPVREKNIQRKSSLTRSIIKGSPLLDRRNIERQVYQSYNLDRRSMERNVQQPSDRRSMDRSIRQCSVRRSVERNTLQSPSSPTRNDVYQSPILQRRTFVDNSYQSPTIERRKMMGNFEASPVLQRHPMDRNFQFPSLERRKLERRIPSPSPTKSLPSKLHSLDRRKLENNVQSMQHFSSLKKNMAEKRWSSYPTPESETGNKVRYNSTPQNSTGMINKVIGSLDKLKIDLINKG